MTDVCCLVIKDHHDELSKSATAEFGFNVFGFGSRLLNEFENAESAANRRKNVGPAIRKLNDALPAGQRLPGRDLATLMRATDTFYVPFPRPDAEEGWVASNRKCKDLLEAIYHNLERGANALNVPSLTGDATRHAALNFAISDGQLAKSIIGLSHDDYTNLLAIAGQLDMENGNHMLTMALHVIRGSQETLDQVSQA